MEHVPLPSRAGFVRPRHIHAHLSRPLPPPSHAPCLMSSICYSSRDGLLGELETSASFFFHDDTSHRFCLTAASLFPFLKVGTSLAKPSTHDWNGGGSCLHGGWIAGQLVCSRPTFCAPCPTRLCEVPVACALFVRAFHSRFCGALQCALCGGGRRTSELRLLHSARRRAWSPPRSFLPPRPDSLSANAHCPHLITCTVKHHACL